MNTPTPPDLGNLSALKVGDEVTTIKHEGGAWRVASRVLLVHSITADAVRVRATHSPTPSGYWYHRNAGGCAYAMHDPKVMRFYYSANPEHIAQAKANAQAERAEDEAKQTARAAQMALARPIGNELGDGDHYYSDGQHYDSETAAETLADKLTAEQLRTLAGWLGVGA